MNNAAYLDSDWFRAAVRDDRIARYVASAQKFHIKTLFCDIGVLTDEGTLPEDGYAALDRWITHIREVAPSMKVVPALNYGRRKVCSTFGSPEFTENLAATIRTLVIGYDIDGIHLDIEGFLHNDWVLLRLLEDLKANSPSDLTLSIATPDFWTPEFITNVAEVVDQVTPMLYDSQGWGSLVTTQTKYRNWYKAAVHKYAAAIGDLSCELVPCFPTYEKKTAPDGVVYHDPAVESMKIAITATNKARAEGARVDGAAIFWFPHFLGLHQSVYNRYTGDQNQWRTYWMV